MEFTVLKVLGSLSMVLGLAGCAETSNTINEDFDYGVFLSLEGRKAVEASEGFEIAVIDAQNISAIDIAEMKARDQEVYSYLNIGSLETFRSYYKEYQHLALKSYDNWEEEYWVDAGNEEWQKFVAGTVAQELLEKGIDGFWIDNTDVYGQFADEEIYDGVASILKTLMSYEKPVVINGGDQFVLTYLERNGQVDDILTGVNQETVFSSINFENNTFTSQSAENKQYYLDYLNALTEEEKDIYLLEYTTEIQLAQDINEYTKKRGWKSHISDSIELDD
ncbi:MAG: endo alpha-1,4 polygalactosaminidase [Desemzia incerta]